MTQFLDTDWLAQAPSLFLVAGWFGFLRYSSGSGYFLALVSLPGTIVHEAMHWLVGKLLGARPESVSLFPRREGNGWVLGSVGFARLNIFNAAFVAFAPLLMLPLAYASFMFWLVPCFQQENYGMWLVGGYFVACCLFSATPSSTDIKVGFLSAAMYGCAGYMVWQLSG